MLRGSRHKNVVSANLPLASQHQLNNHRPRCFCHRCSHSQNLHLSQSMARHRIKPDAILFEIYLFPESRSQFIKLSSTEHALKSAILHPSPVTFQQIMHFTAPFVVWNIVNHHIEKHGLANLVRFVKLRWIVNKLFVSFDLLVQQIPLRLFTGIRFNFLLHTL